jgi:hypothetical protein
MKYRKKPAVIEAVQWKGDNLEEVLSLVNDTRAIEKSLYDESLVICALEGEIKADKNDWIIKGIKGECYPYKPDIFEQTYELVEE